jgi:hypothetical protein
MSPKEIKETREPAAKIAKILARIHAKGPVDHQDLHELAGFKLFHPNEFQRVEPQLLGLFYKTEPPEDLLSFVYRQYGDEIKVETGHSLTPVQASIRQNILDNRYFSFSAPTSAGKSYLLRELLRNETSDVIIVVPSRALIAEYLTELFTIFANDPRVLILQFIDYINLKRTRKRIFVVTPERALEATRSDRFFDVGMIIFDEAQISEEEVRGIGFDAFVRKSDSLYPTAKKVFAHPFVENPSAQLHKHDFVDQAVAKNYQQGSVGKLFIQNHKNSKQYLFSPYIDGGHKLTNCLLNEIDRAADAIKTGESLLVFTSKASIISGKYKRDFSRYLDLCDEVTDEDGVAIINEIEDLIGAEGRDSDLVSQMRRGVVIHHGSIPLAVRTLIERFTRLGLAKICFATSTLAQGVNMPFKVVWIHNLGFQGSPEDKALGLKNLIGRAGRTTQNINDFDYGFVIVEHARTFTERFQERTCLTTESVLDRDQDEIPEDWREFVEAIKKETIDDGLNLPKSKIERLSSDEVMKAARTVLSILFSGDDLLTSSGYSKLEQSVRRKLKQSFHLIFERSVNRPLEAGEKGVLSAGITILLMKVQGRSFKEILAIRYNYITKQSERRNLERLLQRGEIDEKEYSSRLAQTMVDFSMPPHPLPNKRLTHSYNEFAGICVSDLKYDRLVYDTYDYLDKVISFSLADVYVAVFTLYYEKIGDPNALRFANYMRHGTADEIEIALLRYGFTLDELDVVAPHVESIDDDEIVFKKSIESVRRSRVVELVKRYTARIV